MAPKEPKRMGITDAQSTC